MLHSDKRYFFERYSFIKHSFQLELHSKSLFHKLIAISRYGTNSDSHAKSSLPKILSDMSHSDESIIGKWYKVHKSEIKLHNGDICQIWGMQIFFYAIGKGWGAKGPFWVEK